MKSLARLTPSCDGDARLLELVPSDDGVKAEVVDPHRRASITAVERTILELELYIFVAAVVAVIVVY